MCSQPKALLFVPFPTRGGSAWRLQKTNKQTNDRVSILSDLFGQKLTKLAQLVSVSVPSMTVYPQGIETRDMPGQ